MEFRGKKLEKTSFFPQVCLLPHWQVVKCASGHVERFLQSGKKYIATVTRKQTVNRSIERIIRNVYNKQTKARTISTNDRHERTSQRKNTRTQPTSERKNDERKNL